MAKQLLQREWELVRENFFSGTTVALVAVPLSLSLAIASGVTPMMGISTAVFAPLINGAFGGSHYNILGPAGALVNIVNRYAIEFGSEAIPPIALSAGVITLLVFSLHLERFATYLPLSVIEGFTWGIATTIALTQLNFALGLTVKGDLVCGRDDLPDCTISVKHSKLYMNVYETLAHLGSTEWESLTVFTTFLLAMLLLSKKWPKFPWIVLFAVLGIVLGVMVEEGVFPEGAIIFTLRDKYGSLERTLVDTTWMGFNGEGGTKGHAGMTEYFMGGIAVALVSVMETLLSAKLADNVKGAVMRFRKDKEIGALGLSGVVCGLVGALPCNGVIVRTTINVNNGATNQRSQFISGVMVFVLAIALIPYFSYLPMSVIAAILLKAVYAMVPVNKTIHMFKMDKSQFLVLLVVWVVSIVEDGFLALVIGIVLCLLLNADQVARGTGQLSIRPVGDVPGLDDGTVHKDKEVVIPDHASHLDVSRPAPEAPYKAPADVRRLCLNWLCGCRRSADPYESMDLDAHSTSNAAATMSELDGAHKVFLLELTGTLNYLNCAMVEEQLLELTPGTGVVLSVRRAYHLDVDGVEALCTALQFLRAKNIYSAILGPPASVTAAENLLKWDPFRRLCGPEDGKMYDQPDMALAAVLRARDHTSVKAGEHDLEEEDGRHDQLRGHKDMDLDAGGDYGSFK